MPATPVRARDTSRKMLWRKESAMPQNWRRLRVRTTPGCLPRSARWFAAVRGARVRFGPQYAQQCGDAEIEAIHDRERDQQNAEQGPPDHSQRRDIEHGVLLNELRHSSEGRAADSNRSTGWLNMSSRNRSRATFAHVVLERDITHRPQTQFIRPPCVRIWPSAWHRSRLGRCRTDSTNPPSDVPHLCGGDRRHAQRGWQYAFDSPWLASVFRHDPA